MPFPQSGALKPSTSPFLPYCNTVEKGQPPAALRHAPQVEQEPPEHPPHFFLARLSPSRRIRTLPPQEGQRRVRSASPRRNSSPQEAQRKSRVFSISLTSSPGKLLVANGGNHNRLYGMHSVLRLIKNLREGSFEHVFRDFLSLDRRKTV